MNKRVFLLSCLVGAAISFAMFRSASWRERRDPPALPENWVDSEIRTPYQAKASHRFWAGVLSSPGQVALDALDSPELFSRFFPGYPEAMRTDRALWRDYFSREFDVKTMSETLSGNTPFGVTVYLSWAGCMDIFRRYGADVVIFGASDVAQAIPTDLLSDLLKAAHIPGLSNPRVLNCTGAAGVIDSFDRWRGKC